MPATSADSFVPIAIACDAMTCAESPHLFGKGGADDIERFVQIALSDAPFPI